MLIEFALEDTSEDGIILLFVTTGHRVHTRWTHNQNTKDATARCLTNWFLRCLSADVLLEEETDVGFLACLCSKEINKFVCVEENRPCVHTGDR